MEVRTIRAVRALLLASALTLWGPAAVASEAPVVAVFEVQDLRISPAKLPEGKLTALTDLLENFLAEGGAFKVVPQSGLRRAMVDAKRATYQECFDEACQIEIGKAVSASKLVTTKIIQVGAQCIVTSTLFDLRTETTDRAEHAKGDCTEESLALTLEKVAIRLKADRAQSELEAAGPDRWDPGAKKRVIASFRSEPPGALVQIDGELACQDSSAGCRRTLSLGKHVISMQKERYSSRTEEVYVEDGSEIAWALEPNFSQLEVRSEPAELAIRIDGREAGRTPLTPDLEPGEHLIELADDCYFPSRKRVTVVRGHGESIDIEAVPREGAIDVSAVDEDGNAAHADVYVDGKLAGRAPDLIKVNVCARSLRVVSEGVGGWEGPISVAERQTIAIEAQLRKSYVAESGGGEPTTARETAPPGIGLRVGGQAMLGILCLHAEKSGSQSTCVDRLIGYGGLFDLQWPTNRASAENGWFFRGNLRAGFLYYPGSGTGPAVFEIPAALAAEVGLTGQALEYALGGEGLYVFRKFSRLIAPDAGSSTEDVMLFEERRDSSPHAVDLGLYLVVRLTGFELGGGVYVPITGIGDSILARMWLGFAYDL